MATSASASTNSLREQAQVEELLRQILRHVQQAAGTVENSTKASTDGTEEVFRLRMDGVDYALVRSVSQSHQQSVGLSPREQAIVRLIIKGHSNKTIARIIDISPWTVATHLRRVFAKLEVNSRSEMVARVLSDGLLISENLCSSR